MQAGASEAQAGTGLAFRTERLQRRPQRFRHRRLQPAAGPRVIGIDPPEAIADRGNHAGVVAGTSSSLLLGSGSRSGASSGSDAGSGISITLTGLLVNPMPALVFTVALTAGRVASAYLDEAAGPSSERSSGPPLPSSLVVGAFRARSR